MDHSRLKGLWGNLQIPAGIDWVGMRFVREVESRRAFRDAHSESQFRKRSEGVQLEVLIQGQFAYASTPRVDQRGLQDALDRAVITARQLKGKGVYSFSPSVRPRAVGTYRSPVRRTLEAADLTLLCELLKRSCEVMKVSETIVSTQATLKLVETEVLLLSSAGSEVAQSFQFVSSSFGATARKGDVIQERTDGGAFARSLQGGLEALDDPALFERLKRVGNQAWELVEAEQCPDLTTQLVLMPDQMMLQIHESIGHPLELDRILGDERNYAGSSFVKLEDFGQLQYGSRLMNVTFDPTVPGEFASYAFDDGGRPAEREFLIRDGVLLRGLGGAESQTRSGVPGVSNFRACDWNRAPIDRMANLNLEPGADRFEDIVGSVEDGILMESNRSWSIDDYRNKFQFGCEYARRIRNGKLAEVLRNPNYRGVTNPFWRGLSRVGAAETWSAWGTPYCGKGEPNQIIRVGHGSPVCLFDRVEVFGGA